MSTTTDPAATDRTAGLRTARANASRAKRNRALDALRTLEATNTPITAAAVAHSAGVSTWLLYTDGIREHLDAARRRQTRQARPVPSPPGAAAPAAAAGLRTDLALARDEIHRLRAEHDKLRGRLRLRLGAEIEGPDRAELITRVSELESTSRQLLADRDARAAEADHALRRTRELEDDLTAARESLRRVIKNQNTARP